jgi:uncharacterized membrane protein
MSFFKARGTRGPAGRALFRRVWLTGGVTTRPAVPRVGGSAHGNASRRRWASAREALATQVWPVPVIAIAFAVGLGILLPIIDAAVDAKLNPSWSSLIFDGGTDSARAVLTAISGSLITATSLTFSLTVVALQLASSQASPRILRMFAKDPMVHATLAVFLGTFAFALTVLRTVKDSGVDTESSVPRIAVTVASLATLASVVMLTLFLAHLATQLRIETMMRNVHAETKATIDLVAATAGEGLDDVAAEVLERPHFAAIAHRSGFISAVDRGRLLDLAGERDLVIEELHTVGSSVVRGTPIAWWWFRDPLTHPTEGEDAGSAIGDSIASAYSLTYERTASQDIGFGLRQLVDIAARALSPGVNDPTTAVHALSHLSALLCDLVRLPPQPRAVTDAEGVVRLLQQTHDIESLLELAVQQPRHFGAGDATVAERLYGLLREVGFVSSTAVQRELVAAQVVRLDASVAAAAYDATERERFAQLSARCAAALRGEWLRE